MKDSPYWNWELGVCEKHMLPSVPCPACLAEAGEVEEEQSEELNDTERPPLQGLLAAWRWERTGHA